MSITTPELVVAYSTRTLNNIQESNKFIESTIDFSCDIEPQINDNWFSLPSVYNRLINRHRDTSDYLVLCHDDIIFNTPNWGKIIQDLFEVNPEVAVIGLAGAESMNGPAWWMDYKFNKSKIGRGSGGIYGVVNHDAPGSKPHTSYFSQELPKGHLQPVVACDGVFLAINLNNIKSMFDPAYGGFHFYDVDFCIANHLAGAKIAVTTDIRITHKSEGQMPYQWGINAQIFVNKYKDKFPIIL